MDRYSLTENLTRSIFEPESLLPSQHADLVGAVPIDRPEVRLVLAILEDAVAILHRGALDPGQQKLTDYVEARRWVDGTDGDWPFSFENVCDVLGFDAARFRRTLLSWKEMPIGVGRSAWLHPRRRQNGFRHSINLPCRRSVRRAG